MEFLDLLAAHPPLFIGCCTVLGLLVGSFLNVVIYRLPVMIDNMVLDDAEEIAAARAAATPAEPPAPEAIPEMADATPAETSAPAAASDTADATPAEPWVMPPPAITPAEADAAQSAPPPSADPESPAKPVFNLVVPRSACPNCQAPITALQNIPVVSWLVLGGKCASCKTPISVRYPLVELLTAVASGLVAWHFGYGSLAVAGICFTWMLIALTFIDLDTTLLPDQLTYPLLWIGLLLSLTNPVWAPGASPVTPFDSILGAVIGYMSLWTLNWLFKLIRKEDGMGYGDFKLFAAFGAWFGFKMLLPIILFASLVGSLAGVWILWRQRKGMQTRIPFGPYLAAAGWLFLLVGHATVDRYFMITSQIR
jgi:leader peptidase (prepilin peptidase)/N-methyltransferase